MNFFGIGIPELLLILVIALIVFGPERLPEIGRSIGKAVRDFRQMSAGFTSEWQELSKELEETAAEVQEGVKEMETQMGELEASIEKAADLE
jgi:sec-independent protein translocase protein TatA